MTLTGLSVTTPTIQHRHGDRKVEATHAFVGSEELKSAMQNAAVVGAPTIWRPFLRVGLCAARLSGHPLYPRKRTSERARHACFGP